MCLQPGYLEPQDGDMGVRHLGQKGPEKASQAQSSLGKHPK